MNDPGMMAYARSLMIGTVGLLLAVAVFNAVVDPYGVTGWNRLGIFEVREREYKHRAVQTTPHDALLISHSRLSAQDPRVLEAADFFNLAVGGGKLEELDVMLDRALDGQKLVVLGLDYWMFNGRYWPWEADPAKPINVRRLFQRYLLSFDYFLDAIETVRKAVSGATPVLRPPGYLDAEFWRNRGETDPALEMSAVNSVVDAFVYEPRRMEVLRRMKEKLGQRGVQLQVFLHPESPLLREKLESPALREGYAAWKAEVLALFPDAVDLTGSQYAVAENYYRYDPIHYRPEVSTAFLNEVVLPHARDARSHVTP